MLFRSFHLRLDRDFDRITKHHSHGVLQLTIAEQFADVIKSNCGLEEIVIKGIMISSEGRTLLLEALRCNKTLLRLVLEQQSKTEWMNERERRFRKGNELDRKRLLDSRKEWERIEQVQKEIDAELEATRDLHRRLQRYKKRKRKPEQTKTK